MKIKGQALALAGVSCFLITWMNEGGSLTGYNDLISFAFITKVVSTFVILSGMNTYLANKNFRSDDERTRRDDVNFISSEKSDINLKDVLARRNR